MAIRQTPILGWQPDLAADTPGVLTYTYGVLPTPRGIGNGVTVMPANNDVVTGNPCGGYEAMLLDGTSRKFLGVQTKLYELVGGITTDRSGSTYHATTSQLWTFAQWGNTTLAVNKGDRLQASTTGAFADAHATAPKASIVIVAGPPGRTWAMLFDYDDGTNNYGDGIYWNPSPTIAWTPSIATQCGNTRITDVNGKWTAAVPYRDGVLAFKEHAMYLGSYVGGSDMWSWTRISDSVGAMGPYAVDSARDVVYFANDQGVWVFDGSFPRQLPGGVHDWWARNAWAPFVRLTWDAPNHLLWCAYNVDFAEINYIVFNALSQLWTNYGSVASGSDNVGIFISSSLGAQNGPMTKFVTIGHSAYASPPAIFRLSPVGSDYQTTLVRSIHPQWLQGASDSSATWASAKVYHGTTLRNVLNQNQAAAFDPPGRFNIVLQDFWLQAEISVAAATAWECDSVAADLQAGGSL